MRALRSTALAFLVATDLAAQQTSALVTPAARAADSILTAAVARGLGGVALFIKDGVPVLRKGYGLAQRENRIPFTPNTVVQIGSNTKDFTAVAILQLVEAGRLRLEDSLAKFFPNAPADRRGITIAQLMQHTSGLPIGVADRDAERISRDEFLARVMRVPLQSRPGTSEQYSNAGFSVLAAIIEQLSGTSYDVYVRDHIFRPLGMTDTGYLLPHFAATRLAHGYSAEGDKGSVLDLPHFPEAPSWTLVGNGGMLSTVADMSTFYATLLGSEKLLTAATRNRRFDPSGGMVLAGSDLTSYFVFQHEPEAGLDIFLATTSTDVRAPQLLRQILPTLGMRERVRESGDAAKAAEIPLPATSVGRVVREYLDMFNGADSAAALRFFAERIVPNPNAPPIGVRLGRLREMRENLGKLAPIGFTEPAPATAELRARGTTGEVATFTFEVEDAAPYRIRSMRVRVGG